MNGSCLATCDYAEYERFAQVPATAYRSDVQEMLKASSIAKRNRG